MFKIDVNVQYSVTSIQCSVVGLALMTDHWLLVTYLRRFVLVSEQVNFSLSPPSRRPLADDASPTWG